MIGPLPSFALDMFTREGRAALGKLLRQQVKLLLALIQVAAGAALRHVDGQAQLRIQRGRCAQPRPQRCGWHRDLLADTAALVDKPVHHAGCHHQRGGGRDLNRLAIQRCQR